MNTVSCPAPAGKVSTPRKPRPKPSRSLSFVRLTGLLTLVVGKEESSYWLERLSHCDAGTTAVRLTKLRDVPPPAEPQHYDVTASPSGERSCECLGFLRHHHCKHSDALAVLVEREAL